MERILHGTYLLSLEVAYSFYRLVGAHHTETLVSDSQKLISAVLIYLADEAAELSIIQYFSAFIQVFECARHIEYGQIRHERDLRSCILNYERDVPVFAGFQQLAVSAQR